MKSEHLERTIRVKKKNDEWIDRQHKQNSSANNFLNKAASIKTLSNINNQ